MGYAKCNVTISSKESQIEPYEVPVRKGKEDGIKWKLKTSGYKFTGVTIEGNPPNGEFGDPDLTSSMILGRSIMKVSDKVSKTANYPYELHFLDAQGKPGTILPNKTKPQIKNQ